MSVPGGWEGGSDALRAGARSMRISSFLGAFLSPSPGHGPGERCSWHRMGHSPRGLPPPEPQLSGMSALRSTNSTETVCDTTQPLFARKGPETAPFCLSRSSRSAGDRQGAAGTRWHLHSASLKPKTPPAEPGENRGGNPNRPRGTTAARALLFKALDWALLLCNLSSVEFWTFPQPPGHQDCATRRQDGQGAWIYGFQSLPAEDMPWAGRSSPGACNQFPVGCWDWIGSPANLPVVGV